MHDYPSPPILIYDSELDIATLRENKPYRNICQLLMSARSVRDALRLCGAEERILNGSASDYECFSAVCASMEYLAGHPVYSGVNAVLSNVFGIKESLSPYNQEELWSALNAILEDNAYTPTSLMSDLGVESLSLRVSPFEAFDIASEDIDIYAVTSLSDIVSLVTSEANTETELEAFIKNIASEITRRTEPGSYGVYFKLGDQYAFNRMSRKHEVYDIYSQLKSKKNVPISAQNGLITYVLTSLFGTFLTLKSNVILDMECRGAELSALMSYLELNQKLPSSLIIRSEKIEDTLPIALEYSRRNDYGLPSVTALSPNVTKLAKYFPIGLAMEYQNGITDIVKLAALSAERKSLSDELAFDLCYMNIKNRMRI